MQDTTPKYLAKRTYLALKSMENFGIKSSDFGK